MKISAEIIISIMSSIYYHTYCEAQGKENKETVSCASENKKITRNVVIF